MESLYNASGALQRSPYETYQADQTASTVRTSSTNPVPDNSMPAPRRPKAGTKTAQQWQEQAAVIQELYESNGLTLEATMETMQENHGFQASMRQYKAKIKEWGLEKNFRNEDMQAIVRKDSKRKSENPHKATRFRCRKRPVPQHRIERYRRDYASSDETIMGDAATPSDISCETPCSTYLSDHPSPVQDSAKPFNHAIWTYVEIYCGLTPSFPRSAAWTSIACDDFGAHSAVGPTPYARKLIADPVALDSAPDDPDSPLAGCFATLTYRGLLQPLISKLRIDDLLCAMVNLAGDNGIAYYPTTTNPIPWCPAAASTVATAGWARKFWAQWPAYRLKTVYVHAMAGTASIAALVAKIETFINEVCSPETGLPFPVLASTIYPFLSHAELGGLVASLGHILRSSGCRCELLEKLPSMLLFETFLETYRQCALGVAGMSTLDHHQRFNVTGERIKTWLQAPDTLVELHRGYDLAVAGMPPVVMPQTADEAPFQGTEGSSLEYRAQQIRV